jgi:hypothetical protein
MSNNDNNAILKINLNKGKSESNKFNEFYNALFTIFYFILQKPFDSFWWECVSITIQYFQMSIFIIDSTVSIYIIKIGIVFPYLANERIISKNI